MREPKTCEAPHILRCQMIQCQPATRGALALLRNAASPWGAVPLIVGADLARFGDDRFSVAWRRGRKLFKVESRQKVGTVEGANLLKQVIDIDRPARVFIDLG